MATTDIFDLAAQRLAWLDRRQSVLARNVANADSPGFVPSDLAPFAARLAEADRAGAAAGPSRTSPLHLGGTVIRVPDARTERPEARAPDGNAVALDEQLMKVAETETGHELVTSLVGKYMGLFRLALGRAG
jgi:flagellar basal-body rod protein FlgB